MPSAAAIAPGSLTPPRGGLFDAALVAMVILFLTISAFALIELGWQYGESGGSALEKIHPATLLAAFLVVLVALVQGNPLLALGEAFATHPRVFVYLVGVVLLMLHALLVVGLPFTVFIDTFIGPILVLLLLRDLDEERRRQLAWLVHGLFLLNTVLGLAEFALGFRLTPLHIEGETLEEEWRSSALMGHPLSNAMLTGSYMVLLLSGGARDLPVWLKPIVFLIAGAGMVVFGGRAATALILVFIVWHVLRRTADVLRGKPFDPRLVLAGLIGLPVLIGAVLVLADAGFFDRFVSRLVDDHGSAGTRVEMFALFKHLTWPAILFGPDHDYVASLMRHYGLDYGIESFWVSMVLSHGLMAAGAFFVALFLFCLEVVALRPAALAVMIYFFAVASASLSLSAKTPGFAVLILLILVLLPASRSRAAAHSEAGKPAGRGLLPVA